MDNNKGISVILQSDDQRVEHDDLMGDLAICLENEKDGKYRLTAEYAVSVPAAVLPHVLEMLAELYGRDKVTEALAGLEKTGGGE